MDLIKESRARQDLVDAGADQGSDENARQTVADQAQGRRGHDSIADPGGTDDQESEWARRWHRGVRRILAVLDAEPAGTFSGGTHCRVGRSGEGPAGPDAQAPLRRNSRGNPRRQIALGTIVAVLASIAAGVFISRKLSADIGTVRDSAMKVASGDLDVTIEPPSIRELGDLARAFNTMTQQIDALINESRRARMRWASAFASIGDGMILVDEAEQITAVNPAAARLLDVDVEWAVGKHFIVVVRDHEITALLRESQRTKELKRGVIDFSREGLVLETSARPVAGYQERYTIVSLRDITELRKLESVRREFVANVSHELRTPLASIRAVVETLEAGAIDDPEVANEFLGRIVGEVDRLAALVDDLLDLARLESGRVHLNQEALDPRELLSSAAERLRPQIERARLYLVVDIPAGLPRVFADRARIQQVVLNLIHNAIKFTPPDGTITVTAEQDGEMLNVQVIDTGTGIAVQDLPRLFERFYKGDKARRSDGTGLGLAITKHIIQTHEGVISAESEFGEGSTFTFTLPIAKSSSRL